MQPNSKAKNYRIHALKLYGALLKDELSEITSISCCIHMKIFLHMLFEVACTFFDVITKKLSLPERNLV